MAQEDYRQKYIVEVEVQKGNAEKALKDIEKEARETGSEIDKALSGGGGEKAAEGAKVIASELDKAADAAKDVTTEVQQIVEAVEDAKEAVGDGLLSGNDGGVSDMTNQFDELRTQMQALAEENNATIEGYIRNLQGLGEENEEVTSEIINALGQLGGANKDIATETASTIDQLEAISNRISEVKNALSVMSEAGNEDTEGYRNLTAELAELQEKAVDTESDLDGMVNQFEMLSGALSGSSEELENINPILETLNKMQEASGDELEELRGQLVSYIQSLGTKTAAEQGSTAATIGMDMAMKALNRTLKANLITAIMSLLVGLVNLLKSGIGELWKWVSGEKAANDAAEKFERTLKDINKAYERQEKLLRASGATELAIIQNKIRGQKELIEALKIEERNIVKNRSLWEKLFGMSDKNLDKIAEYRKQQQEIQKIIDEDLQTDRLANNKSLQRGYNKDAESRNNAAADEAERLNEEKIKNEYAKLRARYEYNVKKIEAEREAYKKEVSEEWDYDVEGKNPNLDLSGFDKQIANEKEAYTQAIAELNRKYNIELEEQKRITDQLNDANERSKRMNIASIIEDQVIQMRLLNEEHDKRVEAIRKEGEENKKAIRDNGNYTSEQKQTLTAEADRQTNARIAAEDEDLSANKIKIAQETAQKLLDVEYTREKERHDILQKGLDDESRARYEAEVESIQNSAKNEKERMEKIKKVQEEYSANLTGYQADDFANTQISYNADKDNLEAVLNEYGDDFREFVLGFTDEILTQAYDTLQNIIIPQLNEEIAEVAKKGGDVTGLTAKLKQAEQQVKRLRDGNQRLATSTNNAAQETKKEGDIFESTAKALRATASVVNDLTDAFGDYMSESAKEALSFVSGSVSAMGDIVAGIGEAMKISTKNASDSVKAMESASVILAIISAAIQIAMQIAKLIQFYSADAVAERKIESLQKKLDELRHKQKMFKAEMDSKKGTEYWEDMIKMAKSYGDNIKNLNEQLSIQQERIDNARTEKKKEKLKEEYRAIEEEIADETAAQRDAWQSLFDEVLQTDLKGLSDQLADDIFSAFDEGCQDMSDVWNQTINGMLDAALKAQLSRKLQDMLSPLLDMMEDYAKDAFLSDKEMADILDFAESLFSQVEAVAQSTQDLRDKLGIGNYGDVSGSSGAFETMSQDTAEELNGRFTALQMSGAAIAEIADAMRADLVALRANSSAVNDNVSFILSVQQAQLDELERISANTSNLVAMRQDIQQIRARL